MKKSLLLISLGVLGISIAGFAREPANIAITKQQLRRYHDSGAYQNDVANVMQNAIRYLAMRVQLQDFQGYKPAIVLDIDETSLSNYPDMSRRDFGGTLEDIQHDEDLGKDSVIAPTLKLYRFAQSHGVAVFFVTGRYEEERAITESNLIAAGFVHFDGLILRDEKNRHTPAAQYKKSIRKALTEKGYTVILNIGDQQSDLRGGYAEKNFKLPNPYYFIP